MSRIVCPPGYAYDVSVEKCMSQCPAGTEELTTDPNMCVSTVPCPPGTTQDAVEPNVCNKVNQEVVGGACASGYSQWSVGVCSINCPAAYQESFTSCNKKTVLRKDAPPRCDSIFNTFSNGSCNAISVTAIILILVGLVAIVLLWRVTAASSACRVGASASSAAAAGAASHLLDLKR